MPSPHPGSGACASIMKYPRAPFITRRHDMLDSTQRTGSVHWVGAGLSNGSGLRRVAERADRMTLWNRSLARVEELAGRLKLPAAVEMRPFKLAELGRALSAGDIVVS